MHSPRLALVLFLVLSLQASAPVKADIARIELNGAIDPITAGFVVRCIDLAESQQAQFLLMTLQTPGGFGSSMEEIIARMLNAKMPVIVYVTPSGSKAASAGFFILLAADVAAMAPGTNTGAAHPLMAIAGLPVDGGEAGKTLSEKITSNSKAFLRSITAKRNRNSEEAEKGVTESKSFTDSEAMEAHLIDFVARDEAELFQKLEGYKVHLFSGQEVILHPAGQAIADYPMSSREKFLATISEPNLALLLGVAGLILLYIEFSNPGFVAPGVIGGICLLLSILGLSFLPINYVGALLILLAIGLFIAEVKVQGFGILGFGGVAAMVLGMVILIDTPDPAVKIGLSTALALALPFAAIFMLLLVALLKSLKLKVSTGDAGMIGLIGQAETDIGADGRVKVRGEHWRARSEVPIAAGRPVRITEIENLTLKVEEVKN